MKISDKKIELKTLHNKSNYLVDDLDSEIRVDQLCSALLKKFHAYLLEEKKLAPLEAGSQAAGADYFLREFIIGKCRANIFETTPRQVKQFAANWYIVSNLEPNMAELTAMLKGTDSFFQYCADYQLISPECAGQISTVCEQTDYYKQRIEDFHNISGDGYSAWEQACPLTQESKP